MEKLADIIVEHFWAISAAILGPAFVGYIAYRNGKINRFNNAAQKFTDTFHRELKEVFPTPVNWPENIDQYLRARFDNLQEAVGLFRKHINIFRRSSFDKAWFRFYCHTDREIDRNCQCYHRYIPFSGTTIINGVESHFDHSKTHKQFFKKNVEALLKFAKLK